MINAFAGKDVIFAYLNEQDPNNEIAERIFRKLERGESD